MAKGTQPNDRLLYSCWVGPPSGSPAPAPTATAGEGALAFVLGFELGGTEGATRREGGARATMRWSKTLGTEASVSETR